MNYHHNSHPQYGAPQHKKSGGWGPVIAVLAFIVLAPLASCAGCVACGELHKERTIQP